MLEVYGKPDCKNCTLTKNLLDSAQVEYKYIDIMEDDEAFTFLKVNGFRSVPQVFKDGNCVGGYREVMKLVNSKEVVE